MQKFLRFGILCLTLCFTMNCTKTETTPQPTQQTAKGTRKDKSASADVQQLAVSPLFLNLLAQMTNFENKADAVTVGMNTTQLSANAQYLQGLIDVALQNPTPTNREAVATFIGFSSLDDYLTHTANIEQASENLRRNYEGFTGMSETEVNTLIDEAIDITLPTNPPMYQVEGKCERMARRRRRQRMKLCTHWTCEDSVERQYQGELAECD